MARRDAAPLITLADRISREASCAQARDIRALSRRRTALINAGRIPSALQEPLSSGVNALVVRTPPCLPTIPADSAAASPPAVTIVPTHGKKHGQQKEHKSDD